MDDIGDAQLLVLPGDVAGLDTDRLLLPGGGAADVFTDDDGDVLVQVGADRVTSAQLVAGVLRSPALRVHGRVLDLAVVGDRGHDRLTLGRNRDAVLVLTRRWTDVHGPHVTIVAGVPSTDQDGSPDDRVLRDGARLVRSVLAPPAAVTVVHVDSALGAGSSTGDAGTRLAAMQEADLVIPAWGVVPASADVEAVVEELREARDTGTRVLVCATGGSPRTVGRPPGPSADLRPGPDTRLVDAPADWLWGGPLH